MASVNEHMTSGRAWSQRSQVSQGFVKEVSNAINVAAVSEEQKRAYEMPGALDWLKSKDIELDIDDDVSVELSVATFKKIDSLMPKSGGDQGIASMENALAWLRSNTDVDDATFNSFKKIDSVMSKSGVKNSIAQSGEGE
jgi:hypothetical protein